MENSQFTEQGLVSLLLSTTEKLNIVLEHVLLQYHFVKAHLWETEYEIYKLLLPLFEFSRGYTFLAQSFHSLADDFDNLIKAVGVYL